MILNKEIYGMPAWELGAFIIVLLTFFADGQNIIEHPPIGKELERRLVELFVLGSASVAGIVRMFYLVINEYNRRNQ